MNHAARQLLRPWSREVGEWQREVARLAGRAEWLGSKGARDDEELGSRIGVLESVIVAERDKLSAAIQKSKRDLSSHSRIVDVRRAIEGILAGLARARLKMDRH